MKKSRFNLSHMHSTTLNAGYLVPFFLQETLPNDTFKLGVNSFIRATPMVAPLMHRVFLYTQYWYVPYRLLWEQWPDFITGGDDLSLAPAFPVINSGEGFQTGSLADYFGMPINQPNIDVSAMPFRALSLIWNTRYRDEDLQSEIPLSVESGNDETTSTDLLSPSWARDYFTTARNSTQRGVQISVPIQQNTSTNGDNYVQKRFNISFSNSKEAVTPMQTGVINVSTRPTANGNWNITGISPNVSDELNSFLLNHHNDFEQGVVYSTGIPYINRTGTYAGTFYVTVTLVSSSVVEGNNATGSSYNNLPAPSAPTTTSWYWPESVFATLSEPSVNTSGALDIRDLRLSSALQRYAENSLQWGNRYEEMIQREFGIKPRDSRIQRPEYLGGAKSMLNIGVVYQTAEGEDTSVGTMRGHASGRLRNRRIRFTAPEHGLIIGLMSIRPEPVYTQGIHREWLKRSRLDFFTRELANVGMQEVFQQELYANADNKDVIFGYQRRYDEYRYRKPLVTGEFRTSIYDSWNMARYFAQPPVLNDSFIRMSSSENAFKRPFAEQNHHSYLAMIRNVCIAYRPLPKRARNILE